jgi:hypothetical protein
LNAKALDRDRVWDVPDDQSTSRVAPPDAVSRVCRSLAVTNYSSDISTGLASRNGVARSPQREILASLICARGVVKSHISSVTVDCKGVWREVKA